MSPCTINSCFIDVLPTPLQVISRYWGRLSPCNPQHNKRSTPPESVPDILSQFYSKLHTYIPQPPLLQPAHKRARPYSRQLGSHPPFPPRFVSKTRAEQSSVKTPKSAQATFQQQKGYKVHAMFQGRSSKKNPYKVAAVHIALTRTPASLTRHFSGLDNLTPVPAANQSTQTRAE